MKDLGRRQPRFADTGELGPSETAATLAATSQNMEPLLLNRIAKLLQADIVARYRIVLVPASQDTLQPRADLFKVEMAESQQLSLDVCQLGLEFLPGRLAVDREVASPGLPADVRESQKVKCFGGLLYVETDVPLRTAQTRSGESSPGAVPSQTW